MSILKLSKGVMIDGKEVSEIEYDLNSLTAESIDRVSNDLKKQQYAVTVPELDPKFNASLFAISAGLSPIDLNKFPAKDYMKAGALVRDFLYNNLEEPLQRNS